MTLAIMGILTLATIVTWAGTDEAAAGTPVTGDIITDTTWTLLSSPYWIENDVSVIPGVNLTIEAGVEVRFNGSYLLSVLGNLTAVGAVGSEVIFTSNRSIPSAGDWIGVHVDGGQIAFGNVTMFYSDMGVQLSESDSNVIVNCHFSDTYYAIGAFRSDGNQILGNGINSTLYPISVLESSNNTIANNYILGGQQGIRVEESSNVTLTANDVWNCTHHAYFVDGFESTHFTHNILGTNKANGKPFVYYSHILDMALSDLSPGEVEIAWSSNVTYENTIISGGYGMTLTRVSEIAIGNVSCVNGTFGLYAAYSANLTATDSIFASNSQTGITSYYVENIHLAYSNVTWNGLGVGLGSMVVNGSFHNINFYNNAEGFFRFSVSSNITVHASNFVGNTMHATDETASFWDNGSRGNYWDNYTGPDVDSNGIGDTPHLVDSDSIDRYPLVNPVPDAGPRKMKDGIPPADITDLGILSVTNSTVEVGWTVPGDDGYAGMASEYNIRYLDSPLDNATWDTAMRLLPPPTPLNPLAFQSVIIGGLSETKTYYIGIKTADEVPNWSNISNVVSATTLDTAPPKIENITVGPADPDLGYVVNVSADITDASTISEVLLVVSYPNTSFSSDGLLAGPGDSYYFERIYDQLGLHSFLIRATDNKSNTVEKQGQFTTFDRESPVVDAGPSVFVEQHEVVVFDGANSTDNHGISNFTWMLNDPGLVTLFGPTPSRVFDNVGDFEVTLNVSDSSGNYDEDTMWVKVTLVDDLAPEILDVTVSPSTQYVGQPVNISARILDNTDVASASVNLSLEGQFLSNDSMQSSGDYYHLNTTHGSAGSYSFVIWATDVHGNWNASGVYAFDILPLPDTTPPACNAGSDQSVTIGTEVTLDGSLSTDDTGIVNFTWTFEENASTVHVYGPQPTYGFHLEGDFLITLNVTDASGSWAVDTVWINITVPLDTVPPAIPQNLTVTPSERGTLIVDWSPNDEPDLAGYRVYRSETPTSGFELIATLARPEISIHDTGLADNTLYYYCVEALDTSNNTSPCSEPESGRTIEPPMAEDHSWLFILVAVVAVLVIVLALVVLMRRRATEKGKDAGEVDDEPSEEELDG